MRHDLTRSAAQAARADHAASGARPARTADRGAPAGAPSRRSALAALLGAPAALALLAAGGCNGGGLASVVVPSSIVIGETEIAERARRLFPMERRLLGWVDVQLEVPRIALRPQRNRVGVTMRARTTVPIVGRSPAGEIAFETGLRIEPSDLSLRFVDVRVERLDVDLAPPPAGRPAAADASPGAAAAPGGMTARVGRVVAEEMLEGAAIWRADDAQRERLARLGVRPTAVTVRADGIEIALSREPAPSAASAAAR